MKGDFKDDFNRWFANYADCRRGDHDFRSWTGAGKVCYNCFERQSEWEEIKAAELRRLLCRVKELEELVEITRPKGRLKTFLTWLRRNKDG